MDRVKSFFNKPWDPTMMETADPMPDFAIERLRMVYWTLFLTAAFSLLGAYSYFVFSPSSWITTLSFVANIFCLSKVDPSKVKELHRLILLLTTAYSFGAAIGPLINFIVVVDQRDIMEFFVVASIFFLCYLVTAVYSDQRHTIYRTSEFLSTTIIPTWVNLSPFLSELTMSAGLVWMMIILGAAVLIHDFRQARFRILFELRIQILWFWLISHHISFNVVNLVVVYLSLVPLTWHMVAHSQKTIAGEKDYVSHTIDFLTHFPALTNPRHFFGAIFRYKWGMLRNL